MLRRSLLTLVVLFAANTFAQAQTRRAQAKATQARNYCQGDKLPAGFVIVGLKQSQKCGDRRELEIKKPAATGEVVCDGSPVPEGYSVAEVTASAACRDANLNPLTNAMTIVADGTVSAPPAAPRPRPSRDEGDERPHVRVVISNGQRQEANRPKTVEDIVAERANEINRQANTANAIRDAIKNRQVMIDMTKDDVLKSWGTPYKITRRTSSSSGHTETWWYRNPGGLASLDFTGDKLSYFSGDY